MEYCEYCGNKLQEDTAVCTSCGCPTSKYRQFKIKTSNERLKQNYCEYCGSSLSEESTICLSCGCPSKSINLVHIQNLGANNVIKSKNNMKSNDEEDLGGKENKKYNKNKGISKKK